MDNSRKILNTDVVAANGFDSHPEVGKLKPWNPAFWVGSGLSSHKYVISRSLFDSSSIEQLLTPYTSNTSKLPSELFDLVEEGRIRVYIADITRIFPK